MSFLKCSERRFSFGSHTQLAQMGNCVHGCLVAPLYGKWNPNVMQAVHLEKRGEKNPSLPEVGQFVNYQKKFFKPWQNTIFN